MKVDDGKTVKRYKKKNNPKKIRRYGDVFSHLLPSFYAAFLLCAHRQMATFTSRAASVCLLVKIPYNAAAVRKQRFDTFHNKHGDQPKEFSRSALQTCAGSIFKRRRSGFASIHVDQIAPNRKFNAHRFQ